MGMGRVGDGVGGFWWLTGLRVRASGDSGTVQHDRS